MTTTTTSVTLTLNGRTFEAPDEAPGSFKVGREGDRPLRFRGWLLGEGNHGTGGSSGYECDWNRRVRVRVYLTTGGNLVTSCYRTSQWQGENDRIDCAAHHTPAAALDWLRADAGGELGRASLQAWEEACGNCPALTGEDAEVVE